MNYNIEDEKMKVVKNLDNVYYEEIKKEMEVYRNLVSKLSWEIFSLNNRLKSLFLALTVSIIFLILFLIKVAINFFIK